MDEFDIEMTSLRDQPAPTDHATIGDPTNHSGHATSITAHSGIRAPLGKPLSRQRLFRMLAIVLTILLPLALILGTNPNLRAAIDSLLHPVTTFANSTTPGSEQFDLVHIAPWGDLRIDGQSVPPKQVLQRFRAVKLAPGTHTLDYSAPPFAPLHCILTVPANPTSDTCPLTQNADDLYPLQNDDVRMLDLRASFNNLSGQQLATLIKAAEAGLATGSPTTTVAPGEHYLTATRDIAVATQPLRATLVYHLSTDSSQVQPSFEPLPCSALCFYRPLLDPSPNGWGVPAEEWGVLAHVALSWSYAIPHGSIITGPIDPEHDTVDVGVPLHITWQHGWRITPLKAPKTANAGGFRDPICAPAEETIVPVVARLDGSEFGLPAGAGAEGCLIQWRASTGHGSGPSNYGSPNYLLYRFGMLLAANDQAHHTFPTLPLADPSEQSLAQQLATEG